MVRDLVIPTADGPMPAVVAEPDQEPRGAVVVVQEAFGLTPHIQTICTRLASAGWTALAPALFHRQGSPVFAYDDFESVLPVVQAMSAATVAMDVGATFDHLTEAGFAPAGTGIIGFCLGGSISLVAASERAIGAAITFYGGGLGTGRLGFPPLVEVGPDLRTPWLGLFGDQDQGIPVEEVEAMRAAAATAPVATEVVRYPDAGHGFNCDDRPASFHAASAADAWTRTIAWFEAYLSPA